MNKHNRRAVFFGLTVPWLIRVEKKKGIERRRKGKKNTEKKETQVLSLANDHLDLGGEL